MAGWLLKARHALAARTPSEWRRIAIGTGLGGLAVLVVAIVAVSLSVRPTVERRPGAAPILSRPSTQAVTPSAAASATSSAVGTAPGLPAGIYASKIADLGSVFPSAFAGYDGRDPTISGESCSLTLVPDGTRQPDSGILSAVVRLTDYGSAGAAATFVAAIDKAFGSDVRHATVSGAIGLFATDGVRVAAFRYARGRYVLEVMVSTSTGSPVGAESEILRLAALMPVCQP